MRVKKERVIYSVLRFLLPLLSPWLRRAIFVQLPVKNRREKSFFLRSTTIDRYTSYQAKRNSTNSGPEHEDVYGESAVLGRAVHDRLVFP